MPRLFLGESSTTLRFETRAGAAHHLVEIERESAEENDWSWHQTLRHRGSHLRGEIVRASLTLVQCLIDRASPCTSPYVAANRLDPVQACVREGIKHTFVLLQTISVVSPDHALACNC